MLPSSTPHKECDSCLSTEFLTDSMVGFSFNANALALLQADKTDKIFLRKFKAWQN